MCLQLPLTTPSATAYPCSIDRFVHRLLMPFFFLSLCHFAASNLALSVAQFVSLWLVFTPTFTLFSNKDGVKVPASHFMNNGTYIKPLAVCICRQADARGERHVFLLIKCLGVTAQHSTTLHTVKPHKLCLSKLFLLSMWQFLVEGRCDRVGVFISTSVRLMGFSMSPVKMVCDSWTKCILSCVYYTFCNYFF